MIQITFTMKRNGYMVVDVTYGNYQSFEDAARQISKEINELAEASVGYFGHFQKKEKFCWTTDWNWIEDIVDNKGFEIGEAHMSEENDNYVRWDIVVKPETTIDGKGFCLENF